MSLAAVFTVGVIVVNIALLIFTRIGADLVLIGGVSLLLLTGILSPSDALAGLANEGMVTVGILYVVVAGLRETGGVDWLGHKLFGRPANLLAAQTRLMAPIILLSTFLNNTPLVAMMIPTVNDWAKRQGFSPSKLMIPLSYAAIFGGTCSLIGTSTNLVINGLLISQTSIRLNMFDIAWVGIPCAVVGMLYILLFSRWLLPDRQRILQEQEPTRAYSLEMIVEQNGPLVSKTIESAGLRHLQGLFLAELERKGRIIPAVSPQEPLLGGDRLLFVGSVETIVDLQKIRGLIPAPEQLFKLSVPRPQRILLEAVVSAHSPMVGQTIREGRFRTVYNAVIIGVARANERLQGKLGDIVLHSGDILLLEAHPSFLEIHRNSKDFYLLSGVANSSPLRHERSFVALGILVFMVTTVTLGWLSMLEAAILAAALMLFSRCATGALARRSVDWQVLLVIAASFGLGRALELTGAAESLAHYLIHFAGANPFLSLAIIYAVTTTFTELITNNGAAVLMFPIALATANNLGVDFTSFAIAIMMAASASFATPIGYQTNLMVMGPGAYHFSDYLRVGIPLNILLGLITVLVAPMVWPF